MIYFELGKTACELIQNDLVSAGFVVNDENGDFNPKTKGKWLYTITDAIEMTFTPQKINKLLADIKDILMQNVLTPEQLAKITGQLSSMCLAIERLLRLFTRKMYHEIENRVSWYEPMIISKETKDELEFWLNNIYIYKRYTFKPRALTTVVQHWQHWQLLNKKKDCEKLLAVKYVLDSFGEMLRNQFVQVNIDNSSSFRILSAGSAKPYLQNIARLFLKRGFGRCGHGFGGFNGLGGFDGLGGFSGFVRFDGSYFNPHLDRLVYF